MKNYILLFLIGITFVSCSNDDDTTSIPTSTKIIGNWSWTLSSGGIDGSILTPASTGYTQRLEITSDVIKYYFNDELDTQATYTIEVRESSIYNETREMIITDFEFRNIVEFRDGKLILIGDCNDCLTSEYVRE